MRIVIDMQGAQAQSRERGIGRYTTALVRGLIRQSQGHELILALNGRFDDTLAQLRKEYSQWLPNSNICVWHAPGPVYQLDAQNEVRWQTAEVLYEHFLASLEPDCVLVTSLFEGIGDEAVTSVGKWCPELPVACVLYDLIPLLYPKLYLASPAHERWYHEKLESLRRSQLLLAISESSRQEAINHLSWPAQDVVNIASAAEHNFHAITISEHRKGVLRQHYGLDRPFLMYTGGIDHRKNIDRLVKAFATLPDALRRDHQLAIVCKVHDAERTRLETLARRCGLAEGDLVLTGYIPEHDLVELYNLCEAFVFPSIHEGFGLPALEAMCCGAPVIGSNRSSLPEVIGNREALFDPEDIADMAARMEQVLTDQAFRKSLLTHASNHAPTFSWDNTARAAIKAIEQKFGQRIESGETGLPGEKPTLAMVSPLPPQRSGISDYTVDLLHQLRQYYRISLVVQGTSPELPASLQDLPVVTAEEFRRQAREFDRVLYQFGNSEFHYHMFELLRDIPGIVVLHDFFLSGVLAWDDVHGSQSGAWQQALLHSHGYQPLSALATGAEPSDIIWRYPANLGVIQQARKVIVHAPTSCRMAEQWYGSGAATNFVHIPLLRQPASSGPEERARAREALGIPEQDIVVCSFGFLGATKLNHELVQAWNQSALSGSGKARLVFVGGQEQGLYKEQLDKLISQSPDPTRIHITGWVSMDCYRQYLAAADIGVQLRTRSRGETSASVLDCLNYGLATIVNANGSMADLPESTVVRLPDEFSVEQLAKALENLYYDSEMRNRLSDSGEALVHQEHAPAKCARTYYDTIEAAYLEPVNHEAEVIGSVAEIISGSQANSYSDHHQLAADIDWDFPPNPRIPCLLIDITDCVAGEGDQVLSRHLLGRWLLNPPPGYRVEPVYFDDSHDRYRYARQWVTGQLHCSTSALSEHAISVAPGDTLIDFDLIPATRGQLDDQYQRLGSLGINVHREMDSWLGESKPHQLADRLLTLIDSQLDSAKPRLLVDISELVRVDAGTGIQRVVKQILRCWFENPPGGRGICPVYSDPDRPGYWHAYRFTLDWHLPGFAILPDTPVNFRSDDIFVGLDLQPAVVLANSDSYRQMRDRGVQVWFVLYDLIAISHPQYFLAGAKEMFTRWLHVIAQSDGIVSISRAVRDELAAWLETHEAEQGHLPALPWFHLGADPIPEEAAQSKGSNLPPELISGSAPTLLMVGTIEPRKAYQQVVEAFEHLWQAGSDCRLVIVGKKGWLVDDFAETLREHPEQGERLFWLDSASDAQLRWLYQNSDGLLAASWAEGFGLPLIEAARHGLSLLVRDIPVFREVAGDHASYFNAETGEELAEQIRHWVSLYHSGKQPQVTGLHWLTWSESAKALSGCLGLSEPEVAEAPAAGRAERAPQ